PPGPPPPAPPPPPSAAPPPTPPAPPPPRPAVPPPPPTFAFGPEDNTSGQGERAIVPPEIRRWNWGAFLLNWIWGVVHGTYIALLMFVPLVNVVMIFVLGAKGSEWAWRNTRWRDVAHFKRVHGWWAFWGPVAGAAVFVFYGGGLALLVWQFPRAEAYLMAVNQMNQSPAAIAALGPPPIRPGFPWGNISTSGDSGNAEL